MMWHRIQQRAAHTPEKSSQMSCRPHGAQGAGSKVTTSKGRELGGWGAVVGKAALATAAACWSGLHCSRLACLPPTGQAGRRCALASEPAWGSHHRPLSFLAICWRQAGSAWKAARSLPNTCSREVG